jgi:hypothetical protein
MAHDLKGDAWAKLRDISPSRTNGIADLLKRVPESNSQG